MAWDGKWVRVFTWNLWKPYPTSLGCGNLVGLR